MAKQELVTVQHVKNNGITRQMTVASAKMNSRLWRIVDPIQPVAEVKKKDVNPVAAKPGKLVETANSFVPSVSDANDDLGNFKPPATEFATIVEPTEKENLQAEYEEKSGKAPDKRWNEARLRQEISALNPVE